MQQLVKLYQSVQKENLVLNTELEKNKITLQSQNEQIKELQKKIDNTHLHANILSKQDAKNLEKKINGYLKDVNTCLTLLNKD